MVLIKYKHNADSLYRNQEEEFAAYNVDFFSCYENHREDCINCETTFKDTFINILAKIDINQDWTFMDCGSGLGLPLYLASHYFRKVYGVEVMSEVAEISKDNLNKLHVTNYEIISSDITKIDDALLDAVNVFYLFNPFINAIFEKFLFNVSESIKRCNREVWLVYVNAVHADILSKNKDILPLSFSIDDFRQINFYHHKIEE